MHMTPLQLHQQFLLTREDSALLTRNLSMEDQLLQSMPDASPTKWHLAHTTWFFDTFILLPRGRQVTANPEFEYLFNSYYNQVGPQYPRAKRGLISRPSLGEIWQYREALEEQMVELWDELTEEELALIKLGIHHEQQHQELIITDIKHALSLNPQFPVIVKQIIEAQEAQPLRWHRFPAGEHWVGCGEGFCFDNEKPRHRVFLHDFQLANRPAINSEYLDFINDGGYRDARHWLSEGWAWVQANASRAPLYWQQINGEWFNYTLAGVRPVIPCEPVCHINYFEASAFASWCGKRLPTEFEWEVAAQSLEVQGHFLDSRVLHPLCATAGRAHPSGLLQMFGDVWEWTRSAHLPYPGYHTPRGAVGEYNAKFMINQWVLRGGSCATPAGHLRASYRNFFPVTASWQFSGVRLADDIN